MESTREEERENDENKVVKKDEEEVQGYAKMNELEKKRFFFMNYFETERRNTLDCRNNRNIDQ